jgi:hypothetical protein
MRHPGSRDSTSGSGSGGRPPLPQPVSNVGWYAHRAFRLELNMHVGRWEQRLITVEPQIRCYGCFPTDKCGCCPGCPCARNAVSRALSYHEIMSNRRDRDRKYSKGSSRSGEWSDWKWDEKYQRWWSARQLGKGIWYVCSSCTMS